MPSRNTDDSRSAAQRPAIRALPAAPAAGAGQDGRAVRDLARLQAQALPAASATEPSVATCTSPTGGVRFIDDDTHFLHAIVTAPVAGASPEEAAAAGDRMEGADRGGARRARRRGRLARVALAEPAGEGEPVASRRALRRGERSGRARIRSLRADDRLPRGVAHWTR